MSDQQDNKDEAEEKEKWQFRLFASNLLPTEGVGARQAEEKFLAQLKEQGPSAKTIEPLVVFTVASDLRNAPTSILIFG